MSAKGRPERELVPRREARKVVQFAKGRPERELVPQREAQG
jgi:hypothetical protein